MNVAHELRLVRQRLRAFDAMPAEPVVVEPAPKLKRISDHEVRTAKVAQPTRFERPRANVHYRRFSEV
jgi:hypothetical protein